MYLPALFLLVGLSTAATTGSFCSTVKAKSCKTSGTAFCSSYLKIPAKTTTVTTTSTSTVIKPSTITIGTVTTRVGPTVVQPVTATTTIITTATTTSTSITTETGTYSDTHYVFENFYPWPGGCTFDGSPPQKRKRATSSLSRPPCLTAYTSGAALSSACKCLSIPTSTKTVTVTSIKTTTVVKPTTVQSTKTSTSTVTIRKTTATNTVRRTRIATETTTETSFTLVTIDARETFYVVNQYFPLENYRNPDTDNNKAQVVDHGMQFSAGGDGQKFTLGKGPDNPNGPGGDRDCTLMSDQGEVAFINGNDMDGKINFIPTSVLATAQPTGLVVQCQFSSNYDNNNFQLFCKSQDYLEPYNAGRVDEQGFWYIPPSAANATGYVDTYQTFGGFS